MTKQAPIRTRSWLFTPATRPERFAKASQAGADVAILDLEDAVAPEDKVRARTTALDYLAGNPSDSALHALRINGLDTRAGISDLDVLLGSKAAPDFLVLPKTETAGHLLILDRLLTESGKATRLIGLIESARGRDGNATARGSDARCCGYGSRSGRDRRLGTSPRPSERSPHRRLCLGRRDASRLTLLRSA
jgi:(S)-citramalyl-CoA lyase